VEDPSGEGTDLPFSRATRDVGPRKRRVASGPAGGLIQLGRSHSRQVGARFGGRGREWLGGDRNHVIARARGEGADRNPRVVGLS
jgi:hypothetical protein